MVRVLRCHHFTAQEVLNMESEPLTTCTSQDKLFVATQCYIEVFDLTQKDCPRIQRIPTINCVHDILYNEADDYIATLEETPNEKKLSVRVYLNWKADLGVHPMRARVAGNSAGSRLEDDDEERLEVVEIPLKDEPRCIATCNFTGNLGVAVGKKLLIYGLCCKVVECCKKIYEDIKSLLELRFEFSIKEIAMCEEFILCASKREFQVIRLNLENPLPSFRKDQVASISKTDVKDSEQNDSGTDEVTPVTSNGEQGSQESISAHVASKEILKTKSRVSDSPVQSVSTTPSDRLSVKSSETSTNTNYTSEDFIVDDEYHKVLDFSGKAEVQEISAGSNAIVSNPTPAIRRPPSFMRQSSSIDGNHQRSFERMLSPMMTQTETILLESVRKAKEQRAGRSSGKGSGNEIVGPCDNLHPFCPVLVEFEDSCGCSGDIDGVLDRGVTILLYKKFDSSVSHLHSAQLQPVYFYTGKQDGKEVSQDHQEHTVLEPCYDTFASAKRPLLIGMYCMISTGREGFLYEVYDGIKPIASYPYTAQSYQVALRDNLVFAISESGLEIYTSHTSCAAMHYVEDYDQTTETLPPWDLEPCLVGLQPFIGVDRFSVTKHNVVILTKLLDEKTDSNDSWSIYVLTRPRVLELFQDMVDLASSYRQTSTPPYLHLLQEAHMLLRSHVYFNGSSQDMDTRIRKSAMKLGIYYAGCQDTDEIKLSLPYLSLSGYSVGTILQYYLQSVSKGENNNSKGILFYLDHVLFENDLPQHLSQEESDFVLDICSKEQPEKLSLIILKSNLKSFSNEKALEVLQKWMGDPKRQLASCKKLDLVALSVIHLSLGNPSEAEALLFSISKANLVKIFVDNHHLLHHNFESLSHVSQLLRKHKAEVLLEIFFILHGTVLMMETTLALLGSNEKTGQSHKKKYLELLLNDGKKHFIFQEAAMLVANIYLECLRESERPGHGSAAMSYREIVPRGNGHFAQRYVWLDRMPPFNGESPAKAPCSLHMPGKLGHQPGTSLPTVTGRGSSSHSGSGGSGRNQTACGCCMCNETLLKLQALLCSKYASDDLCNLVTKQVDDTTTVSGSQSLLILCLAKTDPLKCTDYVMEKYPDLIADFTQETFRENQDVWVHITDCLFNTMRQNDLNSNDNGESCEVYKNALSGVLEKLSVLMTPTDFVNLLPSDDSMQYFGSHVEACVKAHEAEQLRINIMEEASKLET